MFDVFTQYQEQGPDYIAAILKGYENPPAGFTVPAGKLLQPVFPGQNIAHAAAADRRARSPIDDGAPETRGAICQGRRGLPDVGGRAASSMQRKRIGFQVMIFLIVLAGLLYFTKKKVWRAVH